MTLLSLPVFLWLTGAAVCAWALPRAAQPLGAALCTAAFLAYHAPLSLLILSATSLSVFVVLRRERVPAAIVLYSIGIIAAIFVWFKLHSDAGPAGAARSVMPLGLSYYSFRQIHYIFESYKRKLADHTLSDYLCYLFFLPTLHVGPIHRFPEFLRDLKRRRWDPTNGSLGLERILYGYVKIVFLGNYLTERQFELLINSVGGSSLALTVYLHSLSQWANLYFQFSGYSDVAIGFSLFMGFHVRENFNRPFLAENVVDFWQRWHMSLTSWCKDYVFIPLASLTRLPVLSVLAAMLILGLWHEFSGRYVLWGCYQAAGILLWHWFQDVKKSLPEWKHRWVRPLMRLASVLLTLNFIVTSMIVSKYLYAQMRVMF